MQVEIFLNFIFNTLSNVPTLLFMVRFIQNLIKNIKEIPLVC